MRKLIVLTLTALLAVSAAEALQITQTQNYSGTPNFGRTLTFNQFDDNGGTYVLNTILVRLALNSNNGSLILDNDGEQAASGNWEFGAKGDISSTDVALLNSSVAHVTATANALYSGAFSLAANTGDGAGDYDPSDPDGMSYNGGFTSDTQQDYIGSSFWSSGSVGFRGTGTYDIELAINQWYDYGSIGGIEFAATPVGADGCVTVIYDYNVIPEPATLALFGLGLGLLRKRKAA